MNPSNRTVAKAALLLAGLLSVVSCAQAPARKPPTDPDSAVQIPNTEHIPSKSKMRRAKEAYNAGRYKVAMEYYKLASRWADKFGQFNVGLMYVRGQGVESQPARGWAWLELSAERGYPQFVESANKVYGLLDGEQRKRGREILEEELLPEYGDEVAVERTANYMERKRRNATGSNTGFVGSLTVYDRNSFTSRDGEEFYAEEKWDFERIVELERRFMINLNSGSVKLRDFRTIDDEQEKEDDGESK